jgi:hypothetical protein
LGLLDHLTDDENRQLQEAAQHVKLIYPVDALDLLGLARDLIWRMDTPANGIPAQLNRLSHGTVVLADDSPLRVRDAIHLANQQLAKSGSDARFYFLMYPDDGVNGPERPWAVIYLDYPQRHDPELQQLIRFHPEQPHTWMPRRVDDLFAHLRDIGLLATYSEAEIESARSRVDSLDVIRTSAILEGLPSLTFAFDTEYIYDDTRDYPNLITETAKISRGIFTPENIRCTSPEPETYNVTMSFDFNGQRHEKTLRSSGDWVNFDYLRWINEVLGHQGGFHGLYGMDQIAVLIFLTPAQLTEVLHKQRIALDDSYGTLPPTPRFARLTV